MEALLQSDITSNNRRGKDGTPHRPARAMLAASRRRCSTLSAGSGTVGIVSEELGRRSVLLDINPEYLHDGKGAGITEAAAESAVIGGDVLK